MSDKNQPTQVASHAVNQAISRANVSEKVQPLVDELVNNADSYRVKTSTTGLGVCIVDAGIDVPGGLAAGRLIGEICMGGLGTVQLKAADRQKRWWWHVDVAVRAKPSRVFQEGRQRSRVSRILVGA